MKRAILATGLLTLLVCSAYAQDTMRAKIPFDFVAAGTTLPAGTYEFRPLNDFTNIEIRNVDTQKVVLVPVITGLGTGEPGMAKVTFDRIGDKRILEAVLPGTGDGYLLHATKEKHAHDIVKAG